MWPLLYRTDKHKIYLKKHSAFISLLRGKALSVTNINWLIQFRTMDTVHWKDIGTVCGQKVDVAPVRAVTAVLSSVLLEQLEHYQIELTFRHRASSI